MLLSLIAVAFTVLGLQADEATVRRFPNQGFSIGAPGSGWSVDGGRETPSGFIVNVSLEVTGGLVAASVLTLDVPEGTDAASLLSKGIEGLPARKGYLEHEILEDTLISDQAALGIQLDWQSDTAGRLSIVQRFIDGSGRVYMLQAHAPLDQWDQRWPALESCFESFCLIEATSDDAAAMAIPRLAAKCGSEAEWAADWDEAMQRAGATGRHALVVVRSYPGFDLPDSTAFSTFMDEDVLALVRTRLVPLRLEAKSPAPIRDSASYGMSDSTFGVALLLVDANGRVLADTPHVDPEACLPWLKAQLAQHPEPAPFPGAEDPLDEVELRMDRGELELAHTALDDLQIEQEPHERARALMLRARLHRLRHQGQEALTCLVEAREASPEAAASIDCERAFLLLREGHPQEARALLETFIEDGEEEARPKALLLMATAVQFLDGVDAALPWWTQLTADHPDSRWAWEAAIRLENLELLKATQSAGALAWPRPEVLVFLEEPAAAPNGIAHVGKAPGIAARWLIHHQRDDGSWPSASDLRKSPDLPPDAIGAAIDALAARALLQRGGDTQEAAEAALAFLRESDERQRSLDLPAVYMDYTAWSSWAQLELLADVLASDPEDADRLREFGARLVTDLEDRVRANGGWSYYLSGDSQGESAVEQSISFTTAAAVIGLIRAKEEGIAVPSALIDGGLDCLEAMRAESGLFAYMLYHPSGRATHNPAAGAAGRGPACELALWLGGRSSEERLAASLDLFIEHAPSLAAEVGKALMHAGVDTQGCHYPLFDYMMAARAAARLPKGQLERYRISVQDLLMRTRLADGSFQDTPIMGRVYGTAATLLSLHALGEH